MTHASTLLYNATVLTMDSRDTVTSAIAFQGERILAVGDRETLSAFVGPDTECREMEGATIIPGFYDAHGHILLKTSMYEWVDLNSPPIGTCRTIEDCLDALRARTAATPPGEWIFAYGFDDTLMAEKGFPTRQILDRVSTEHPIFVQHISVHFCILNSLGLELLGIDRSTPDPEGGVIRHDENGDPDGVLEERAFADLVTPKLPVLPREREIANLAATSRETFAAHGITSALDAGVLTYESADILREVLNRGELAVRVHINPYHYLDRDDPRLRFEGTRVTTGGVKIMADGSLQGFTGYLSKPYHTPFKGDPSYRGYPTYSREELFAIIEKAHRSGQFLIHTNGDATIDDALDALEAAQAKSPRSGCRHILIHAQTIRENQLDRLAAAGFTPSFFSAHVYYWGDRHRDTFLGPERAARMNPMRSAMDRGLAATSHCDCPITPANPLLSIWVCVNRLTSSGKALGPDQRISVLEALRAHTYNPAWQNFEEQDKGSLEPGKFADVAVLAANPLECDPEAIRDIGIRETIVGGETVYRA